MSGDSAVPKKRPTEPELRRALSPSKFGANAVTPSSDAIVRKQKGIFTMPKRPRASRHEQNSESSQSAHDDW
jgi:hypothetical protein